MKTSLLLSLTFLTMAVHATAGTTNLTAAITVERPFADVKTAVQMYCAGTPPPTGITWTSTNEVPDISYAVSLATCTFDFHVNSGVLYGKIVATRVTGSSTHLEFDTGFVLPKDSPDAARIGKRLSGMLNDVVGHLERKQ